MAGKKKQQKNRVQSRADSRRAQRVIQARKQKRKRTLTMIGGAVAVALIVVVVLILFNRDTTPAAANEPVYPPPELADVPMDGMTMGDPNAPVTVIEFGDFQCPACGQFARFVEPELIQDYVATGKVLFKYHIMAFIGEESREAAEAALCARDQGKFWEMHTALFHNQVGENDGAFSSERLEEIARSVNLDMAQFNQCMDENTYEDEVMQSAEEAVEQKIQSTPSFLVNGELVVGGDYARLREAIDEALANPSQDNATPEATQEPDATTTP